MSDVTRYVPEFLLHSKVFQALYSAQNEELTSVENAIEDILNQCFIDTATWGLDLWDEFLGMNTKEYTTEERRSILKNKLLMQPPFTVARLYDMLRNTADNVCIREDYANYSFEVTLLTKNQLRVALNKIMAQIEETKPAHLAYQIILGFLHELQAIGIFNRWFSDVLKRCGTITISGEETVTTLGRSYADLLVDLKQAYFSVSFPVVSEQTFCSEVIYV